MKLARLLILGLGATALVAIAGEAHVVVQKNRAFSVSRIQLKAGESINFKNADGVAHNLYSTSKVNAFHIASQGPGESNVVQFATAGTTEVRCAFHPKMKLSVQVEP